ncbi:MAG TPA: DoxX family membrane protein [Bacteroidales bacterium]|nr:DoxX family membrane protein [Bacteroidales bacterium]
MMSYSKAQTGWLVILRVAIGWHFLYEGLVKLLNPNWSSAGYLLDSAGFMEGFFYSLVSNPTSLLIVDQMNIWGLILIGLALILGLMERPAYVLGIVLLAFYYLSHPPFVGLRYAVPGEGSYLIVNKNLIELFALAVLFVFPSGRHIGIDRFIYKTR